MEKTKNGLPLTGAYVAKKKLPGYRGQMRQDAYMNEEFAKNTRNGIFVDVGAFDGAIMSNSYFFETQLDWAGICIEAHPAHFAKLKQNRNCTCVHGAAFDKKTKIRLRVSTVNKMLSGIDGAHNTEHRMRGKISFLDIDTVVLKDLFVEHGIKTVDYLSVDTEGSELEVLKGIDFTKTHVNVINFEHNFDKPHYEKIKTFLVNRGFRLDRFLGHDVFFKNKRIKWSWCAEQKK
jgi:FkbM family methyltransferase